MNDALGSPQSVLVLGGTSDIAVATVKKLAASKTRQVTLAGRNIESLQAVASQLHGATVDTVQFDALAYDTHGRIIDEAFDTHDGYDLVILAFGVLGNQEEDEAKPAQAVDVIGSNFTGAASALLHLSARMKRQGHGHIVVLSTVAAERARSNNFVYGASKAGLDAFSQGLCDSLKGSGVAVTVVRPGFVRSKMTAGMEDKPMATTPEAVADDIVGCLARKPHTVWSPSKLRLVFAVMRHLPRPIFRLIKQ